MAQSLHAQRMPVYTTVKLTLYTMYVVIFNTNNTLNQTLTKLYLNHCMQYYSSVIKISKTQQNHLAYKITTHSKIVVS